MCTVIWWLISSALVSQIQGKVIFTIRIYNYRNELNLKHDGTKCENFHWLGDHCDPMFSICVTSVIPCDILNKKIEFWKNKKTLHVVLNQEITFDTFPKSISVKVKVDDHDKFDSHDHIAIFSSKFDIKNLNKVYRNFMKVTPESLNVGLQTSVSIKCANNYYGKSCNIFCVSDRRTYKCNLITGEKICNMFCGIGKCVSNNEKLAFSCQCFPGWTGDQCNVFKTDNCALLNCNPKCQVTSSVKECYCISNKNYRKECRELLSSTTTSTMISQTVSSTPGNQMETREITKRKTTKMTSTSTVTDDTSINFITNKGSLGHLVQGKNIDSAAASNILMSSTHSTIIIICLFMLLCFCVITMSLMIRNCQRKNKMKFFSPSNCRPLPPIIYQKDSHPKETFTSHVIKDLRFTNRPESEYDSCTVQLSQVEEDTKPILANNYEFDTADPYEEPIINNIESLTWETECNDSDDSDTYEKPIKL